MVGELVKKLCEIGSEFRYSVDVETDKVVRISFYREDYFDNGYGLYGYVPIEFIVEIHPDSKKAVIIQKVAGMTEEEFEKYEEEVADKLIPELGYGYDCIYNFEEAVDYLLRHKIASREELDPIIKRFEELTSALDNAVSDEEKDTIINIIEDEVCDRLRELFEATPLELINANNYYELVSMAKSSVFDAGYNEYIEFVSQLNNTLEEYGYQVEII